MHFFTTLLIPSLVSAMALKEKRQSSLRAAYMLSDDPAGASIIAMAIDPENGTLGAPTFISTGGVGLQGINISSSVFSPNDPLFTQDAVVVSGNYLFTVVPGSNELAMFTINPNDPTDLTLISSVDTLGEFPCSVAYSPQQKMACVANGGRAEGLACFSVDHRKGLTPITGLLTLGINQTTSPIIGPFSTISDVAFSPSGKYVMATIKGPSMNETGSFYIYPVSAAGVVASTPIITRIPEVFTFFTFGFSFLSDTKAYVTDAAFGGALVSISSSFEVSVDNTLEVPGQHFSCWTSYAPRFDAIFLADAEISNLTIVDPVTGIQKGYVAQDSTGNGNLAVKVDRHFLYALKADSTIKVSDLSGMNNPRNEGKDVPLMAQVQSLDFSADVGREFVTGLAIWPWVEQADDNPSC